MNHASHNAYLETQVLTATPQKLQLMLIEGALRFAHTGISHWDDDDRGGRYEAICRCRQIVSELIAGCRKEKTEVSRRQLSVYLFLFQALTESQLQNDRAKLDDVVRVLEAEVGTWREVCERFPHDSATGETETESSDALHREAQGAAPTPGHPHLPPLANGGAASPDADRTTSLGGGLSIEA